MVEAVSETRPFFNLEIKILQAFLWEARKAKVVKEVTGELGIKDYLVEGVMDKMLDRFEKKFGICSLPLLFFWAAKEGMIDTSELPKSPLTFPLTDRQKDVLEDELVGSVSQASNLVNCQESILGKFSVANFNAVAARLPTMKDSLPDVYERIDKHLRAS